MLKELMQFVPEIYNAWSAGQTRDESRQVAADERARQERWRNEDIQRTSLKGIVSQAKEAGLSPLAALGFGGGSYGQPQAISQDIPTVSMSQKSFQTENPNADLEREILQLQKEGLDLDNIHKGQIIMKTDSAGSPSAGSRVNNSAGLNKIPSQIGVDPKGAAYITYATDKKTGALIPLPSEDIKNLIEDSPYELEHYIKTKGHDVLSSERNSPGPNYFYDIRSGGWMPRTEDMNKRERNTTVDDINKRSFSERLLDKFVRVNPKVRPQFIPGVRKSLTQPWSNPDPKYYQKSNRKDKHGRPLYQLKVR